MTTNGVHLVLILASIICLHPSTSVQIPATGGGRGESNSHRKTCADLDWTAHSTQVQSCGSNKLRLPGSSNEACYSKLRFDEAEAACTSIGARLCTQKELVTNKVTFGKGCSLAKKFAWSSDSCNKGAGNIVGRPKHSPASVCKAVNEKFAAACCSDVVIQRSGEQQQQQQETVLEPILAGTALGAGPWKPSQPSVQTLLHPILTEAPVQPATIAPAWPAPAVCDVSTWKFTRRTCGDCSALVNFAKAKKLKSNTCSAFCAAHSLVCMHTLENKNGQFCTAKKSPLTCDTLIGSKFDKDAICVCTQQTTTSITYTSTTSTTSTASTSTTSTSMSSTSRSTSTSTTTSTTTPTTTTISTVTSTVTSSTTTTTISTVTSTTTSSSTGTSNAAATNSTMPITATPAAPVITSASTGSSVVDTSASSSSTTTTATILTSMESVCTVQKGVDYIGALLSGGKSKTKSHTECSKLCLAREGCFYFTWIRKRKRWCMLKGREATLLIHKTSTNMWGGSCEDARKTLQLNSEQAIRDASKEAEQHFVLQAMQEQQEQQGQQEQQQGQQGQQGQPRRKPANILFAVADDLTHVSAYGHTFLKTPNFDKIGSEGVLFMRAHTPSSKCAPSRSTIVTGRNPWQLGAAANNQPYFPEDYKSVVEVLENNGYHVGYTGKGWGPGEIVGKRSSLTGKEYNSEMATAASKPSKAVSPYDYTANFKVFLNKKPKSAPFFFWYGCKEPHRAYQTGSAANQGKFPEDLEWMPSYWPDNNNVRTDILEYAVEAEYFDKHLGQIIEVLEKALPRAEADNTMIIATSDNAMPFPHFKGAPYHHATLMPLAIKWKGEVVQPGRRSHALISFADFAPTFLAAAMVQQDNSGMQKIQGKSLDDILLGTRSEDDVETQTLLTGRERNAVAHNDGQGYPTRGIIQGKFSYLYNFRTENWPEGSPDIHYREVSGSPTKDATLRIKTDTEKYRVLYAKRPQEELFDIDADPESTTNLANSTAFSEIRINMKRLLFAALEAQGDPRATPGADVNVFDEYPRVGGLMCRKC